MFLVKIGVTILTLEPQFLPNGQKIVTGMREIVIMVIL
jgi:hypothetical protein